MQTERPLVYFIWGNIQRAKETAEGGSGAQ